jgi:3-(3-hydroxy-phenyl)propionate hydroxylase
LEWWSIYSANTLLLDQYRDGPVFFIGDPAHIVPIFGVRGLNNGIADAHDIAWKLAWVLNGRAGEALLNSYTPERRGATLDVFANATKSTRFMTPPSRGWRLVRDATLSLSLSQEFTRPHANPRQMTPYSYADSPITQPDDVALEGLGPLPGSQIPNLRLDDERYLTDLMGAGFTWLLFDGDDGLCTVMSGNSSEVFACTPRAGVYPRSGRSIILVIHESDQTTMENRYADERRYKH